MINPGIRYQVTGLYKEGNTIKYYHLVGEDGSQSQEPKDRMIWLISRGIVTNMRIQTSVDKEILLRGKGVNLNNLPTYSLTKKQYGNNSESRKVANSKVNVDNMSLGNEANNMGQYAITKRIMYKTRCLGYELRNHSGATAIRKREDVIELAKKHLISNAKAGIAYTNKTKANPNGEPTQVILGNGCDLLKLPILIVDEHGKIINNDDKKARGTVRAIYMKHGGLITNIVTRERIPFESKQVIVCDVTGKLKVIDNTKFNKVYERADGIERAICDSYLSHIGNYSIEIFGAQRVTLTPEIIKSWVIAKPIK